MSGSMSERRVPIRQGCLLTHCNYEVVEV